MDEDSIDSDVADIGTISFGLPFCGNRNPSRKDVTEEPNLELVLPTGELGDEGPFSFTRADPQTSQQDSSISFTLQELIQATGDASDENNRDKINGGSATQRRRRHQRVRRDNGLRAHRLTCAKYVTS